tara:strand:- start:219 stop:503 length:285 start_codon:yes stop_codon:yes gene_type:complete
MLTFLESRQKIEIRASLCVITFQTSVGVRVRVLLVMIVIGIIPQVAMGIFATCVIAKDIGVELNKFDFGFLIFHIKVINIKWLVLSIHVKKDPS